MNDQRVKTDMKKIEKLKAFPTDENLLAKINEMIDAINAMGPTYVTPPPSAYDLNAVRKHIKGKSS